MRTISFLFFFLTALCMQGQEYTIYYEGYLPKITLNAMEITSKNKTPHSAGSFPDIDKKQNTLYLLSIKKDKSVFKVKDGVYNDTLIQILTNAKGGVDTLRRIIFREDKVVFKDRTMAIQYTHVKHFTRLRGRVDEFLFEEPLKDFQWKITSKTKEILGYRCKMAVSGEGKEMVIAWYTEEIPLNEGPSDYWGLPGLILEINKQDMPFQAIYITKSILDNSVIPPDHLEKTKGEHTDQLGNSILYEN